MEGMKPRRFSGSEWKFILMSKCCLLGLADTYKYVSRALSSCRELGLFERAEGLDSWLETFDDIKNYERLNIDFTRYKSFMFQ